MTISIKKQGTLEKMDKVALVAYTIEALEELKETRKERDKKEKALKEVEFWKNRVEAQAREINELEKEYKELESDYHSVVNKFEELKSIAEALDIDKLLRIRCSLEDILYNVTAESLPQVKRDLLESLETIEKSMMFEVFY